MESKAELTRHQKRLINVVLILAETDPHVNKLLYDGKQKDKSAVFNYLDDYFNFDKSDEDL